SGELAKAKKPKFAKQSALTVVIAAKGYPGEAKKGGKVAGIEDAETASVTVFQAGTSGERGKLTASGGRVLNVTAIGSTLESARRTAYMAVRKIDFPGGFYREDIGWRELERD
ncbi:MAG: phosphoribosylamine--glycine ligase, partial [Sphingomonadales bacterium]|nr:phosphoribosylamine--glycine ligase [Sphingomonadales bacterium]